MTSASCHPDEPDVVYQHVGFSKINVFFQKIVLMQWLGIDVFKKLAFWYLAPHHRTDVQPPRGGKIWIPWSQLMSWWIAGNWVVGFFHILNPKTMKHEFWIQKFWLATSCNLHKKMAQRNLWHPWIANHFTKKNIDQPPPTQPKMEQGWNMEAKIKIIQPNPSSSKRHFLWPTHLRELAELGIGL